MISFVKIFPDGSISEDLDPGDPRITHAFMSIDEYDNIMACLDRYEQNGGGVDAIISNAKGHSEPGGVLLSDVDQLLMENDQLRETIAREQKLNATLLQMHKKASNVDRDLRPKKQHSGYVVQKSRQRDIRFRKGKGLVCARIYETMIQTPFSTKLPMDQAIQAAKELRLEGEWSIEKIGIQEIVTGGYEQFVKNSNRNPFEKNIAVDMSWSANYNSKYWEVTIQHTLPLTDVPAEMQTADKENKD